jgi:hypothetical protein
MDKEIKGRSIQLLAVNSKYKNRPYYICPRWNVEKRIYEFGTEHLGPAIAGKLKAALGISKDPEKGLQADELQIPLYHRQSFNLDKEEDRAIYYLITVNDAIALNSKLVNKDIHLFFINDVQAEAELDLSLETKIFEAKKMIFAEGELSKIKSLCIFIGGIDVRKMSATVLRSKALKAAETNPDKIMEFFEGNVESRLFVLELNHYAIIQYKQGKYYDGDTYMGTLEEAIHFVSNQKNQDFVNSLGKRLLEKKGN